jgi:hypothetical protein
MKIALFLTFLCSLTIHPGHAQEVEKSEEEASRSACMNALSQNRPDWTFGEISRTCDIADRTCIIKASAEFPDMGSFRLMYKCRR